MTAVPTGNSQNNDVNVRTAGINRRAWVVLGNANRDPRVYTRETGGGLAALRVDHRGDRRGIISKIAR